MPRPATRILRYPSLRSGLSEKSSWLLAIYEKSPLSTQDIVVAWPFSRICCGGEVEGPSRGLPANVSLSAVVRTDIALAGEARCRSNVYSSCGLDGTGGGSHRQAVSRRQVARFRRRCCPSRNHGSEPKGEKFWEEAPGARIPYSRGSVLSFRNAGAGRI